MFFERDQIPRTCGRKGSPRAVDECCYAARVKRIICSVWSEWRPAQKKAHGARRERVPLFRELPPKHVNRKRLLPARVRRGRIGTTKKTDPDIVAEARDNCQTVVTSHENDLIRFTREAQKKDNRPLWEGLVVSREEP